MKILTISLLLPLVAAIWPAPQSFTNGTSVVWLDRNIKATYNGRNVRGKPTSPIPFVMHPSVINQKLS